MAELPDPFGQPRPVVVSREDAERLLDDPLAGVVDELPLVLFTFGPDLQLRFTGGGWLRSGGLVAADRVHRPIAEVWPRRPDLVEHARLAVVDGVAHRVDLRVAGRVLDTVYQPVLVREEPDAPPVGAVGVGFDVTAARTASDRVAIMAGLGVASLAFADDLVGQLSAIATAAAQYTWAGVVVRLDDGETLQVVASAHPDPATSRRLRSASLAHGNPLLLGRREEAYASPEVPLRLSDDGGESFAGLREAVPDLCEVLVWPLRSPGGPIGLLTVLLGERSRRGLRCDDTDPDEIAFLSDIAVRAALQVDAVRGRLRLRSEADGRAARARRLQLLADWSASGEGGPPQPDDLARRLSRELDGGVVVLRARSGGLRTVAACHPDPVRERMLSERFGAYGDSEAYGAADEPLPEEVDGEPTAWVPLRTEGGVLGWLGVLRGTPLDDDERAFVAECAQRCAVVEHAVALAAERDAAAAALADSERRFRSAFGDAPVGMFLGDLQERPAVIVDANRAFATITGYTVEALRGMAVGRLADPADPDADEAVLDVAAEPGSTGQRELPLRRADGSTVWVRLSTSTVVDRSGTRYAIAHVEDVTERREAQAELAHRALHDDLTGLPNRHVALDRLSQALLELRRRPGRVAVLYADLDRFKAINDSHGHEFGDRVLSAVGQRLAATVRVEDTPTRLGGDEFVVICRDAGSDEDVERLAARVLAVLNAPMKAGDIEVHLGASVGVAVTADPEISPTRLMHEADTAMYEAKRRGRERVQIFRDALGFDATRRLAVESDLREALLHGRFRLHYQPVLDLTTGDVVAAEALLRLDHPTRGTLPPAEFIDVAEDSSLMRPIGTWAIGEACRALRAWTEAVDSPPQLGVAVNVSGRQVSDTGLAMTVLRAVEEHGLAPAQVCLELTERALLEAGDSTVRDLRRLSDAGVRMAIDDFGTGYSSLTYLQQVPADTIKIDRSFVAGLGEDDRDTAIVEAVAALGAALHLTVVAEGVETPAQAQALRDLGCDRAQGFLFGAPMPEREFAELLARLSG